MILPQYYQDPHTLHVGTLPPHAYFLPAADRAAARELNARRADGERFTLLNGRWAFGWFAAPELVPEAFWRQGVLSAAMPVPGVWQANGFDASQYTNVRYPFPYDPPFVPADNPCGGYVTRFTLTGQQAALRQYLNFEGVDSAFFVWVNGRMVGYSQVSHATAEFDITDAVRQGENTLAVLVLKWCDGSYLEDQDKFRYTGIFRDVYILHRPAAHLRDYTVRTLLTDGGATLTLTAEWAGSPAPLDWQLVDPAGAPVAEGTLAGGQSLALPVKNPVLWNAEHPALYTLWLQAAGECIMEKVGFRAVWREQGVLYINGQNVKFRGVNRHDSDPFVGSAVTREHILRDLTLMKQHNINAIRTSHYPNAPILYQLADEMGFYVMDEADQEAHGCADAYHSAETFSLLSGEPTYREAYLDRAVLLLQRDKNRPCVVIWSAGNESGWGKNIEAMLAYYKATDPTRLTHYENYWPTPVDGEADFTNLDLRSKMYPLPEEAARVMTQPLHGDKPLVLCEYSHAMGNGPGDLEEYFETFARFDKSCGGFIWEWCDHAVYLGKAPDGRPRFGYGGDSGELLHDGNFCMDGLVYPDRRVHTGLLEYKNVIRPGRVTHRGEDFTSGWQITNILDFTPLADYALLSYELSEAGVPILQGEVSLPAVAPHATVPLTLFGAENGEALRRKLADPAPDTTVRFILTRKAEAPWAKAGSLLGFDCIRLTDAQPQLAPPALAAAAPEALPEGMQVQRTGREIRITGKGFCHLFNTGSGCFDRLGFDGVQTVRPMCYNIWRAPTDNDRNIKAEWMGFGYDRAYGYGYAATVKTDANGVTVHWDGALVSNAIARILTLTADWVVDASGAVTLHLDVQKNPRLPDLPRFGILLGLPGSFDRVEYLGYGPTESYPDKHRAGWYGRFTATVDGLFEDYLRPQENGSHWGCRSLQLTDGAAALLASADEMSFNASPYTPARLTEAAHNTDLTGSDETVICLDWQQSGIGSNSCGPRPAPTLLLNGKAWHWDVRIEGGRLF